MDIDNEGRALQQVDELVSWADGRVAQLLERSGSSSRVASAGELAEVARLMGLSLGLRMARDYFSPPC